MKYRRNKADERGKKRPAEEERERDRCRRHRDARQPHGHFMNSECRHGSGLEPERERRLVQPDVVARPAAMVEMTIPAAADASTASAPAGSHIVVFL